MREVLTTLLALVGLFPVSGECPPEVDQFLTLNGESYKSSRPAVVRVRGESGERKVASLGLRSNKCYSVLQCQLVEGGDLLTVRNINMKYFTSKNYKILSLKM